MIIICKYREGKRRARVPRAPGGGDIRTQTEKMYDEKE